MATWRTNPLDRSESARAEGKGCQADGGTHPARPDTSTWPNCPRSRPLRATRLGLPTRWPRNPRPARTVRSHKGRCNHERKGARPQALRIRCGAHAPVRLAGPRPERRCAQTGSADAHKRDFVPAARAAARCWFVGRLCLDLAPPGDADADDVGDDMTTNFCTTSAARVRYGRETPLHRCKGLEPGLGGAGGEGEEGKAQARFRTTEGIPGGGQRCGVARPKQDAPKRLGTRRQRREQRGRGKDAAAARGLGYEATGTRKGRQRPKRCAVASGRCLGRDATSDERVRLGRGEEAKRNIEARGARDGARQDLTPCRPAVVVSVTYQLRRERWPRGSEAS